MWDHAVFIMLLRKGSAVWIADFYYLKLYLIVVRTAGP